MRGIIEGLRLSQKVIKKEPFEEDISEPRRIRVIDALQPIDAETFVEVRRADDRAIVCDSGTPAELVEAIASVYTQTSRRLSRGRRGTWLFSAMPRRKRRKKLR